MAWLFCERGQAPAAQPDNAAQDGRPALDDGTSTTLIGSLDRLQAVRGEGAAAKKDKEKAQLKRALGLVEDRTKICPSEPIHRKEGGLDPPVLAG